VVTACQRRQPAGQLSLWDAPDETPPSPGHAAVIRWSATIHGKTSARHAWAAEAGRLLDEHGPDTDLPPFPSPFPLVREEREATVRHLHSQETPS
jgi:hypothetical protein